jgi:hypothetical protein
MKEYSFDNRFWRYVIFSILFITILRGIRFPNLWSYSHFLFNYDFGFIKRGFIGTIISQLNNHYLFSYDFFFIFSLSIFIINIILLSLFIKDFIDRQSPLFIGVSLVFVSSLAIVFLSHTVGYFEQIGLLFALITLKLKGFYKKIFFLLFSMPIALLIHESILIIFYPVIFMSLLFNIETIGGTRKKLKLIAFTALLVLLVFIIANHTLVGAEANEMNVRLQAKTEQPLRQDAFNVLLRDSDDNFHIMKSLWFNKTRLSVLISSFLVTAPTFLFFIYLTVVILKKAKVELYLILLCVLASISPLLMHFEGWDMHRWNTLSITTSFLMLLIVYSLNRKHTAAIPGYVYPIIIFLIFLNGISSIPLFDGYSVKQFPFSEHLTYIINLIKGKELFPSVPVF